MYVHFLHFLIFQLTQRDLCVLTPHFAPISATLSYYQFFLSLLYLSSKNIKRKKKKFDDKKNKKIKNLSKKRNINLQSYKIIFILKDVDPKDPTEVLSSILSNSEVNFEIEKIERILDTINKSMNKN